MLSYIRESQTEAMDQGGRDNQTLGDAGEDASDASFLTVSGRDQHARNSTVFLTALFVIASIGLVLMAKKSHIKNAGAAPVKESQAQIEMAISRVTGVSSEMTHRMDEIVQKFSEFSDVSQVKVDDLNKNPFQLVVASSKEETKDETPPPDEQVASLMRQFTAEKKALSLLSIIQSESSASCMINGILLEVGQPVNAFIVDDIQADGVRLVWQPDGHVAETLPRNLRAVTLSLKE